MSETTRVVVPYESMDPLAIGATDDESKKHRDTLEVDVPTASLLAVVQPDEPAPVAEPTEAARAALAQPVDGPTFAELLAGKASVAVVIDNQFRPTPSSKLLPPVFDAIDAPGVTDVRVVCANGKVFPMSESDIEQKLGRENLARMEGNGWSVLPERPPERRRVHLRRRLLGRHAGLAARRGRLGRGQDHDRPGPGQPLGCGRRRQADPARRRLGRDGRVEPLRLRDVAADALRRLRRADALRHRRGGDDVRARLHDERHARHARPRDRLSSSARTRRRTARRSGASTRSTRTSSSCRGERPGGHRDLRRLRPHRPPLLPHGLGLHVGRPRPQGRRHDHLHVPSPGVSTAIGDFPGFALMDLMKPYMPPTSRELPARPARHPHARDPDVGRLHLGADLRGDDAQAPHDRHARGEPRDGRRHRPRRDDLDRRGASRGVRAPRRRTRRWSCSRTRATSCRATPCGWSRGRAACSAHAGAS